MRIQTGVNSEFEDHMRPTNFEAPWMRPSTSLLCSALFFMDKIHKPLFTRQEDGI